MASESIKYNCAPCNLQGKVSSIYCFCIDCIEHLCETCLEQHNKFKVTRSHRVLKGENLPNNIAVFKKLAEIGVCKVHQERRVEYKCLTHQEFVCPACMKSAHRSCAEVEDIDTLLTDEDAFQRDFMDGTKELILKVEKGLLNKESRLKVFESKCVDINEHRSKFREELKNLIAYLHHDVTEALGEKMKAGRADLAACIEESRLFKDTLTEHIELANTVLKYGSNQQKTIVKDETAKTQSMIKNVLKIQEERDILLPSSVNIPTSDEVQRLLSVKTLIEERLKRHTQIERSLLDDKETATVTASQDEKTTGAGNLCDAGGFSTSSDEVRCEATREQEMKSNVKSASNSTVTGYSKSTFFESDLRVGLSFAYYDISINNYGRKPCDHIGSILLENESMVFIDHTNDILKLVSSDFRVICYRKLDYSPSDLALAGVGKVVVAVGKSVQIFSITTDNRFVQDHKFLTKYPVPSVCPVGEYLALLYSASVDDTPESSVQIRQLNNRIINNIYTLEDKDGDSVELHAPYLIRSRYPEEIIIIVENKLMAFDPNGKLQWNYKHIGANLEFLSFDSENNMYYCENGYDGGSPSIHQISSKSSMENRILIPSTGVTPIRSILINSKARTIIVGFEDNNAVQVYEFC